MRRLLLLLAVLLCLPAAPALAAGGDYGVEGGTLRRQAPVRAALEATSFDFGIVPGRVTIHIHDYGVSHSTPGHVWLDEGLLDAGRFSWPTVIDEFAHQVDFLVLDAPRRAILQERLGASAWCYEVAGLGHGAYGCERFSSMVAWAYWPTKENAYRPTSAADESASMAPAEFRALLGSLLGIAAPRALPRRA
jgi:hypothetical protein